MTMIELLFVMVIISLLTGIIVMALTRSREEQAEAVAKSELSILAGALEQFRADYGRYPYSHSGSEGAPPEEEGLPVLFNKGYLVKDTRGLRGRFNLSYKGDGTVFRVLDPWHNHYYYKGPTPGSVDENSSYELYSYGKYGVTPPTGMLIESYRIYPQ
jgi:type II secretion system protein G